MLPPSAKWPGSSSLGLPRRRVGEQAGDRKGGNTLSAAAAAEGGVGDEMMTLPPRIVPQVHTTSKQKLRLTTPETLKRIV